MISDTSYGSIFKNCNFKEVHTSQECNGAMLYTENYELRNIKSIYIYSIYTPPCVALRNNTMGAPRLKNTLLY